MEHLGQFSVSTMGETGSVFGQRQHRGLNQIASDYAQHHAPERSRDIVWSMQHSAESLSAILDGLLDGQEA